MPESHSGNRLLSQDPRNFGRHTFSCKDPRPSATPSCAAQPTSYSAAEKGESSAPKPTRKEETREDKEAVKEKAESLQQMIDDLPEDSQLKVIEVRCLTLCGL